VPWVGGPKAWEAATYRVDVEQLRRRFQEFRRLHAEPRRFPKRRVSLRVGSHRAAWRRTSVRGAATERRHCSR
jgi:hypothetical protein